MKKLFALLMVIALAFTFIGCGSSASKELEIKGDKVTKERAAEVLNEWAMAQAENPDDGEGWLKIDGSLQLDIKDTENPEVSTKGEAKLEGKFYSSSDLDKIKAYVKFTLEVDGKNESADGIETLKGKAVAELTVVDGIAYVKTYFSTEEGGEKTEETQKMSMSVYDLITNIAPDGGDISGGGIIGDGLIDIDSIFGEDAENLEFYEFKDGLMFSLSMNAGAEGKETVEDSIFRMSIKTSKGGARLDELAVYGKLVAPIGSQILALEARVDVETALTGSVKAPSDADEYVLITNE